MSNVITGLDIGTGNIKAVAAEIKNNGRFLVLGVVSQPSSGFRKGVLADFEEATICLRNVISNLRQISPLTLKNIFVNVNGGHVKSYLSKGVAGVSRADSEIRREDIEKALQSSRAVNLASNYIVLHNITREFLVDGVGGILDPLGMLGTRLEVNSLVVGAFNPAVDALLKCLERNGAAVSGFIFDSLAASEAVLSKQQKDLGAALLDIGFGTSGLAVYEENKILKTLSFPVGGGNITNDIAIGLRTAIETAEKIKLTFGFALAKEAPRRETFNLQDFDGSQRKTEISKRFLAEIIEARLAEIFESAIQEIKSVSPYLELPAGIVVCGGAAKLPGIIDLIKQEFKLPAQIGLPNLANFDIKNPTEVELLNEPEFATAVGLILCGFKQKGGGRRLPIWRKFLQSLAP